MRRRVVELRAQSNGNGNGGQGAAAGGGSSGTETSRQSSWVRIRMYNTMQVDTLDIVDVSG